MVALLAGGCDLVTAPAVSGGLGCRELVGQDAADYLSFVKLNQITYTADRPVVGRTLGEGDLGPVHARVRCSLRDKLDPTRGEPRDGDAAYLEAGSPLYQVDGYRPSFRLAVRQDGRLVLFQADTNPEARAGRELLDLEGKVRRISVNSRADATTRARGDQRPRAGGRDGRDAAWGTGGPARADQRLAGNRVIPDRLVSLSDPDTRPIRKGKPRSPTEFGYTMLVAECERGFIADHQLQQGNPPDAPQLVPAVERVAEVTGRVAGTVVGDRGFGTAANDRALAELGVARIGLQRKGRLSPTRAALEQTRSFRRLRNWRVGIEARISHLKRSFGLRRTRLRRLPGAKTWAGLGVFAYTCSGLRW